MNRCWGLLLVLGLMATAVMAEQTGETDYEGSWERMDLSLGLGYQDGELTALGRSDRLSGEGWRGIGGLWLDWHSDPESETPAYFRLDAESPGPGADGLQLRYQRQGEHRTELDYRALSYRLGNGLTPFQGAGSHDLRLPDDWQAAPETGGMTELDAALQTAPYEQMRREIRLAHERSLAMRWQLISDVRVQRRNGTRPVAAVMGVTGGNTRAALVPAPVDYETREAEIGLRYRREGFHAELSYFLSLFDGGRSHISWDNPFAGVGGWAPDASHPDGRGHLALPPDNQSQQLRLGLGQIVSPRLRLTADLAWGRSEQKEPFLPYTINPDLTVDEPVDRHSLRGQVDLLRVVGRLNWRPAERLRVDLRYRHEDRDNRTPVSVFNYIGGDAVDQTPGLAHARARLNRPVGFTQDRLDLKSAWRLDGGGQVFGHWRREVRAYDEADVSRTREDRFGLGLRQPLGETQQWSLQLEQGRRRAGHYDATADFFRTRPQEYIDTVDEAVRFDNHPLMYRYNLADRDQRQLALRWDTFPSDRLQLGAGYDYSREDYDNSPLGLEAGRRKSLNADLGWQFADDWQLDAFASHDRIQAEQNNRSFRGFAVESESQDPDRDWRVKNRDRYTSLGTGLNFRPREAAWRLRLEWVESRSRSAFDLDSGPALDLAPLPAIATRSRLLSVSGEHELSQAISLHWAWHREMFHSNDWAWQDEALDSMARVIGSGQTLGREDLNWLSLSLRWSFRP